MAALSRGGRGGMVLRKSARQGGMVLRKPDSEGPDQLGINTCQSHSVDAKGETAREGSTRKASRQRVWVIAGVTLAVIGVAGWRLQRRFLPTCGQMAAHVDELMKENDPKSPFSPGDQRQRCVDQEWPRSLRASFMASDTVAQYQEAFFAWCRSARDGDDMVAHNAMCF